MSIRVLIVDNQAIVRQGLRMYLQTDPELEIVTEVSDGQEALRATSLLLPDVVLMDLLMPKRDGITAAKAIHEQIPGMNIIALSSTTDYALIASAVLAGVSTYLYKGIKSEQLIGTLKGVVAGRVMLLPTLVERLLKALPLPEPMLQPLLSDEIVLLRLLASQHCDAEIAEQLGVDEVTVRSVVERIQTKLAASSRLLAVLRAMQLGLIERTLIR